MNDSPTPNIRRRWWPAARDVAPLVSLVALVVFFSFASPSFLKPGTLVQVMQQGAALAIVACGLTFVLLCAEIDLSVGMVALWTACFCGWLFDHGDAIASRLGIAHDASSDKVPLALTLVVILVPMLSSVVLGLMAGLLTIWSRLPSFIITLAMMYIAEGSSRWLTQSETLAMPPLLKTLGNDGLELTDRITLPFGAVLAAGILLAGHVVLRHTRFGRYVYMTGGNREAARLAGVRTGWIVVACLAISAVTAGVGGLLGAGRLNSISLDQNQDLLLKAVACVVLGGTSLFGGEGGMGKTLIGVLTFMVLFIGLAQITWIDDLARQLLLGVVLMSALVVNGLLAKRG